MGSNSLLVCNYGYGNMKGNYIYEVGPAASKCKSKNTKYPGLCSVDEQYTDDMLSRSGWDLKPKKLPNGATTVPIPSGCDDDEDCRKMLKSFR